jgi:hypothetical protein
MGKKPSVSVPSMPGRLRPLVTKKHQGFQITECTVPVYFLQCGRAACGWNWWSRKEQIEFWINEHSKICKARDLVLIPPRKVG